MAQKFKIQKRFFLTLSNKVPFFVDFCPRGHLMDYHLPNVDNRGHLATYHLPPFVHVVIEQPPYWLSEDSYIPINAIFISLNLDCYITLSKGT